MTRLILVHGGNAESPGYASAAGWEYGIRDNTTPYAPVFMFDYDWKKATTPRRWARYLTLISQHKPYMAMAPDFECPTQWETLKKQFVDIKRAGSRRIIVTPKFEEALEQLPAWDTFIIGVSVPTTYAGFLPNPQNVAGRDIHLLGGHPDQWVYLKRLYESAGGKVVSIDGNNAVEQAREYGKYWSAKKGGYVEMRGEMFETPALILATLKNTKQYLLEPPAAAQLVGNDRVQKCIASLNRQQSLFSEVLV